MKKILLLFVLMSDVGFSQYEIHTAKLTLSKPEILSTDTFTVTYELSDIQGYIYIGIDTGKGSYFEVFGESRWEGQINRGEKKVLEFKLRLKQSTLSHIGKNVPIVVEWSRRPFGKAGSGVGKFIHVKLKDYEAIKKKQEAERLRRHQEILSKGMVPTYPSTGLPDSSSVDTSGTREQGDSLKHKSKLEQNKTPQSDPLGEDLEITWRAPAVHFRNATDSLCFLGEFPYLSYRYGPRTRRIS